MSSGHKKNFHRDRARISSQLAKKLPAEQSFLFEGLGYRPVIIPRPEHCISRKNIDREALKVLYHLKDSGYIAYLVGGGVRDLLLGRRPKDFDVGTNAKPEEVRRLFHHSRIIGRRFRLVHVYFRGAKIIEVSTFRRQSACDDREALRLGIDNAHIFGLPQEDAFRRDLTVNGLFYNIADFSIIDYVGGMADLRQGIIRAIGSDPGRRFLRDPVRMMRAVRHAARIDFTIEPNTWEAILRHSDKIHLCAIPRVRDEWLKDIRSGYSRPWAELMLKTGLFASVFPGCVPVLKTDKRALALELFFGLLARLDRMIKDHAKVSDAFILALFLYAWFYVMPEWQRLKSRRLRWPTQKVRSMVNSALYPYDFRKAVKDVAAQILSSQWPISMCISRDNWPRRVWNKPTFQESIMLYDFVQEILGLPLIGPNPYLLSGIGPPNKSRREPYVTGPVAH
ncbi:MAG: poly(A) polymerase [Nitrospiraceae bacterium]|nr:poly(A) polymerase [Nitrospiraceae bacterium]